MVRSLPGVVLASTIALATIGCGGDGGERLSRDEFVDRATEICGRAEERIGELEEPTSVAELETYARDARGITEEGVDDLRELEPPQELEEGFDRYLEAADEVIALLGELEQVAEDGEEAEALRIAEEIGSAETSGPARAAGIEACENDAS